MIEPPNYLDGAKVIKWAWSGREPFGTIGNTNDDEKEEVFGLAVCKYDDSDNFYRFSCDKNCQVVNDALHNSIEDAIEFLPEQYKNAERNWLTK
ncbi:MAG TPA: hypothetical protein VJ111_11720 [Chitinophagaceae bacterium]|nr:hypothetical protein [Chitinophagaceae bacterium]